MILSCQKNLFEIPDSIHYLNCGFLSPLLKSVKKAGTDGLDMRAEPWNIAPSDFFDKSEKLRSTFSKLLGSSSENIAIIPSVSYGIALAASHMKLKKNSSIVLLKDQFPSNVLVWKEIAQKFDCNIKTIDRPENELWENKIIEAIDLDTKIVALPEVHWTDGYKIDLQKISKRCKEVQAKLVVDVTQSFGAAPFNLQEIDPDYLVTAAYKWLLGPYSMAYMYIKDEHLNNAPLEHSWLNRKNSENFSELVNYQDDFQPGARKFDMGQRSSTINIPMALAALEQIKKWGLTNIIETISVRTKLITDSSFELGLKPTSNENQLGHMLGIKFPKNINLDKIVKELKCNKIFVSQRGDSLRVSPHLYNNENDINAFIGVLKTAIK